MRDVRNRQHPNSSPHGCTVRVYSSPGGDLSIFHLQGNNKNVRVSKLALLPWSDGAPVYCFGRRPIPCGTERERIGVRQ